MKRTIFPLVIAVAVVALAALPGRRAVADDETDDVEIKIQAPLDGANCGATPPTISVLGLTIDITNAVIETQNGGGGDDGDAADDGGDGDDDGGGNTPSTCADLLTGQAVEVTLASDGSLTATKVDQNGDGESDITVEGPITAVDTVAQTITVLTLTIDLSTANLGGADDDDNDGNSQPIQIGDLTAGQFVQVKLASSTAPFTATELELKNSTNQVEVEVDDNTGQEVDDADDDVSVDVTETVLVTPPAAAGGAAAVRPRLVRRTIRLHAQTNGSFRLGGLATGRAIMTITRGNTAARRGFVIRGNRTATARVRLRTVRHR